MWSYGYGITLSVVDIEHLLVLSDGKLFRNMQKCEHCFNHLLHLCKNNDTEFRPAGQNFL